jgi:hypothetical protein
MTKTRRGEEDMNRMRALCAWVMASVAVGFVMLAARSAFPAIDPREVSGASPDTCFDCKDLKCDYCAKPDACKESYGYCEETVRSMSQYCEPRFNGQWDRCKTRIDPSGACITRLMNPCTSEHPICWNPVDKCGPLAICIPEGVCIP